MKANLITIQIDEFTYGFVQGYRSVENEATKQELIKF